MEQKIDKRKKYLTQVLCILCAIALWLFVTYTEDPTMELWVRDVAIAYQGTEHLEGAKLAVVESKWPDEMSVKIKGKRSAVGAVLPAQISAAVDLTAITASGDYALPVTITLPSVAIAVAKTSVSTVSFRIDDIVTVEKTISVTSAGADDLDIHDFAASPATATLTGPKSVLEHLAAAVHVNLQDDAAADTYPVRLFGINGEPYEGETVTAGQTDVEITATRSVPISMNFSNKPENVTVESMTFTPDKTDVRGTLTAIIATNEIRPSHDVWVDWNASPAKIQTLTLTYPENVQPVGTVKPSVEIAFKYAE